MEDAPIDITSKPRLRRVPQTRIMFNVSSVGRHLRRYSNKIEFVEAQMFLQSQPRANHSHRQSGKRKKGRGPGTNHARVETLDTSASRVTRHPIPAFLFLVFIRILTKTLGLSHPNPIRDSYMLNAACRLRVPCGGVH